jgi:glycosyltransferase involved in cell wall biosynthesis
MAISQAEAGPADGGFRHLLRGILRFASPRRWIVTCRYLAHLGGTIRRRRADRRLTVAVDINSLYEPLTGIGWYVLRLLTALAERTDLQLRLYGQALVAGPGTPQPTVSIPSGPALEPILYTAPDGMVVPPWRAHQILRRLAPLLVAADGNDVLFAPNYLAPRLFRFASGARVATVFDLTIYRLPWTVRPDSAAALRAGLERSLFESDCLLTASEAVRGELLARGISPERVVAIHLGPGQQDDETLPLADLPGRYVLFVGTIEPRKNLPLLLAAWRLLRARDPTAPPLVLAGGWGWAGEELHRLVNAAALEGWVKTLGYVDSAELASLYRGAAAVVLPSLYEGFGLPVVEALFAGTPLLLADLPVLREIAGDAALYAPLDAPERWAELMARLLTDETLRSDLARRGARRRAHFDWAATADATAAIWNRTRREGRGDLASAAR